MIPLGWEQECVPRFYNIWNGDVWKNWCLKSSNLRTYCFQLLLVIREKILKKNNNDYSYKKLNDVLNKLSYKDYIENYFNKLPIISAKEFNISNIQNINLD